MRKIRTMASWAVVTTLLLALAALFSGTFVGSAQALPSSNNNSLTVTYPSQVGKAPYAAVLWRLPNATGDLATVATQLAQLNDAQLDQLSTMPRNTQVVDSTGQARFTNLVDGRYYVRAALANGTSSTANFTPLVVDLPETPATAGGGTDPITDVTAYPKVVLAPGSIPPLTPPGTPPPTGEKFLKTDPNGRTLAGATYVVMTRNSNGRLQRFLLNGKVVKGTSANDGTFTIQGLPVGTYYLMETTAPRGYKLSGAPTKFTVTSTSLNDEVVLHLVDWPKKTTPVVGKIPKTGDISLLLSLALGGCLIGAGMRVARKSHAG